MQQYTPVHPLPDWFAPRMRPYAKQTEALEESWREEYYGLLPEQGCGKSKIAIDNMCLLAREGLCDGMLLLAIKKLYRNWTRESDEFPGELQKHMWSNQPYTQHVWDGATSQARIREREAFLQPSPGLRVLAMNVEALSAGSERALEYCEQFLRSGRMMVVVDQNVMKSYSERTKAILWLRKFAAYRRILTGTVSRSPLKFYWLFEFLKQGYFGYRNVVAYRSRYCVMRTIWVHGRRQEVESGEYQNLEELSGKMYEHAFRVLKSDCMDLPPKVYCDPIVVEMSDEQRRMYREMRSEGMALTASGEQITTQIVAAQHMKLRQICCGFVFKDGVARWLRNGRADALVEALDETDQQTIVWAAFKPEQAMLMERLEREYGRGSVAHWHSHVSERDMEQHEMDFQAGRRRIILASPHMGAWGRTWTAGTNMIYYSHDPDVEMRMESEDRAHRGGQTRSVSYTNIVGGPADEKILLAQAQGLDIVKQITRDGWEAWT